MRFSSFQIQNFKSIDNTGVCRLSDTDNILVLAGQNEAGKSAVLEALNFFRNGPSKDFNRLQRRQDLSPQVTCEFALSDNEIREISDRAQNPNIGFFLKNNRNITIQRGDLTQDDYKQLRIDQKLIDNLELKLAESQNKLESEVDNANSNDEANSDSNNQEEVPGKFKTVKEIEQYIVSKINNFTLYSAFRDLLPGEIKISDIGKYPAIKDFEKVFKTDFTAMVKRDGRAIGREEQRLQREASDDLNFYWTQKLEEDGKYNFAVKINPQVSAVDTESKIEFKIDRHDGDPLYMEQKSQGFRWFSAFNLRLRALGIGEANINNLVILIDEPGQGLHEKAQKNVKLVIEELGKKGAQIVYSTHHPNLIGTQGEEFSRIRLVSNNKKIGTKVETVAQFASRADNGSKDALSPIVTAMGMHSIAPFIDAKRYNVVVEGITDHYYLSSFRKLLNKSENIHFIPACGVNNVPNLVSILLGWGLNYKAVFDDDQKSGRKAYNLLKKEFYENDDDEAHKHILKVKDCNGIEDIFTRGDLEKYVLHEKVKEGDKDKKNSEIVKGRKEIVARLFLENTEKGETNLTVTTKKKIEEIFSWLYKSFNI